MDSTVYGGKDWRKYALIVKWKSKGVTDSESGDNDSYKLAWPKQRRLNLKRLIIKNQEVDSRDKLMPDANRQFVMFKEKQNTHCIEIKIATRHKHVIWSSACGPKESTLHKTSNTVDISISNKESNFTARSISNQTWHEVPKLICITYMLYTTEMLQYSTITNLHAYSIVNVFHCALIYVC